ncbi:hypothetical protein D3C87_1389140 [compost metagenome]
MPKPAQPARMNTSVQLLPLLASPMHRTMPKRNRTSNNSRVLILGRMIESGMAHTTNTALTATVPMGACSAGNPVALRTVGSQERNMNQATQLKR